jgi:hypothetical protein
MDPRAILDTLEERNMLLLLIIWSLSGERKFCCFWSCGTRMKNRKILLLLLMIIWSLSGEEKNFAAAGHVELIWRREKSYCCWPCGANLENRKILLLLAMWSSS